MLTKRFYADHQVTIRREATEYDEEDISDDVISISTNKTYGHAAGGFQILLTFNRRLGKIYSESIKPNDIIHIKLDAGDGSGMQSVMIGLVSRAASMRQFAADGKPINRVKISGMDFGKMLTSHKCIADITPLVNSQGQYINIGHASDIRISKGLLFTGTPADLVASALDKLLFNQLAWTKTYMVLGEGEGTPDTWWTQDMPILESTGSVWNAMKSVSNEPWNCLTTETINGRLHIILEPYPFDPATGKLSRSSFHEIEETDIAAQDIGISDHERVTYIHHTPPVIIFGSGNENAALQYKCGIRHDPDAVARHGFVTYEPNKGNFTPSQYQKNTHAETNIIQAIDDRTEAFWNRVKNNHLLESGTIQIHGRPEIKCGSGILVVDTNMEYLAESVSHDYKWGDYFKTTLGVTRGQTHGN